MTKSIECCECQGYDVPLSPLPLTQTKGSALKDDLRSTCQNFPNNKDKINAWIWKSSCMAKCINAVNGKNKKHRDIPVGIYSHEDKCNCPTAEVSFPDNNNVISAWIWKSSHMTKSIKHCKCQGYDVPTISTAINPYQGQLTQG